MPGRPCIASWRGRCSEEVSIQTRARHLKMPRSEPIIKKLNMPIAITRHQRKKRRSRCLSGGVGRGKVTWKIKLDTSNNQVKNGIANLLEGGWMVNSTRLSAAMRAIQVKAITPRRALLLSLCVVVTPCLKWYMRYAIRGEPTQRNIAMSPTLKFSMKVSINLPFSLRSSRDALAVVYNACGQTSMVLSQRRC